MKTILAADVLMAYTNHNIPFHIYTAALDYQMGAVIIQKNDPLHIGLVNWLTLNAIIIPWRKNSSPLSWSLKSSNPCFLVLCFSFTLIRKISHYLQCILHWRLYMEEYGPTILYNPGMKNFIDNTFSWLLHCDVFSNSSGGKCSCCPLQLHLSSPQHQWLPWFDWVLPQLTITWCFWEQPCWPWVDSNTTKHKHQSCYKICPVNWLILQYNSRWLHNCM